MLTRRRIWFGSITSLTLLALAGPAAAHEREFTLSRDWFLPQKGEHEVELRSFWDTGAGAWSGEFEYEYGVTDHFAIEPGLGFVWKDDENEFDVEGADLELRFNFGEFSYDKILFAANVGYEHALEDEEDDRGELKFIVSRYGKGGDDIALNFNVGTTLEGDTESESEMTFGYVRPWGAAEEDSAGWHYQPRFGIEGLEDFENHFTRLGPLAVYRASSHFNMLGAYIFGIDDRDDGNHDELRLIFEWEF